MHNRMTNEEARVYAGLLASINQHTKKSMQPVLQGKRDGRDAMPLFRRATKALLEDKNITIKPTVRQAMLEWAGKYGLQTKGPEEAFTARRWVNMTEDLAERLVAAAGGEKNVAAFLRDAVAEKVHEVEQKGKAA